MLFRSFVRGINLGIEFEGGAKFTVPSTISVENARNIVKDAGIETALIVSVGNERLEIQTPPLEQDQIDNFISKISTDFKVEKSTITTQSVGPSWGADITRQALIGLGVFLLLVIIQPKIFRIIQLQTKLHLQFKQVNFLTLLTLY